MSKHISKTVVDFDSDIWRSLELKTEESGKLVVGPVQIYYRHMLNEVWVATDRSQLEKVDPDKLEWSRWAFRSNQIKLKIVPMMPDRQVTVRPDTPFRLTKGTSIRIYTRVPTWIAVYAIDDTLHKLVEIPTVILSKTWFGDFIDGTLSYWLSTRARRSIVSEMFQPHTVICTLNIRNESDEDLSIEKINLLAERLSIYIKDDQLWSDEMDVLYKGGDQHSELTVKSTAPEYASDAILVTQPRNPVKKSFAERILREINIF